MPIVMFWRFELNSLLKFIAKKALKTFGWNLKIILPEENKFVLIGAPHTSNWDFPLALLAFWSVDIKIHWIGKNQLFRGPLYYFLTALGGIPVNRKSSHGVIEQIKDRFNHAEQMVLAIAPEGTRSKVEYWKSGFYYIALAAKVPICFGYIDYSTRTLGFHRLIQPSGDIEKDMELISEFYQNIAGKYPHKQGPLRIRSKF